MKTAVTIGCTGIELKLRLAHKGLMINNFFINKKLQFTCVYIFRCTMDASCEAYEYNVTGEMCYFLNRTSSAARTLFSEENVLLFVKGEIMSD